MKRAVSVLVVAVTYAVAAPLVAEARLKDAGDLDVSFLAKGPAGMKIPGKADEGGASEDNGKIKLWVKVSSMGKTGIGLRDKHMRGYLTAKDCDDKGKIVLKVDKSKVKVPDNDKTVEGTATGELTLNCVTKSQTFKYKAKRTGSDYHVQALFDVDIYEHDVKPCYLGVCVDKDVKVNAKMKLRDGK
jgi:hypothetical protein